MHCRFIMITFSVVAVLLTAAPGAVDQGHYPYLAQITDDNVHVRSGPGTNYYSCAKLGQSTEIKVVAEQFGWSRIVPPPGSFSWISTQYVSRDPDDPATGIVNGDMVRVYAGSENLKPIHSIIMQVKLGRGEKVHLLGMEQDNYYKIAPPEGAYLWVSSAYTRPLETSPEQTPPEPDDRPATPPPSPDKPAAEHAAEPSVKVTAVVPSDIPDESVRLQQYRELEKEIELERGKDPAAQDYTQIKATLQEIAGDQNAGKTSRYAAFTLDLIKRYDLAAEVARQVAAQDMQLQQATERIESAQAGRMAKFVDLGAYTAVGTFRTSNIYGQEEQTRRYVLLDSSGNIACYAEPTGGAKMDDLEKFIGHRVGLTGQLQPHPESSGALVRFHSIQQID